MANRNRLSSTYQGPFKISCVGGDVWVPSETINKYPEFANHFENQELILLRETVDCACIIQIVLLFLFTGKYQDVSPETCDCGESTHAMQYCPGFGRALKVYLFSIEYELADLADLAMKTIHELDDDESLCFTDILKIFEEVEWPYKDLETQTELVRFVAERAHEIKVADEEEDLTPHLEAFGQTAYVGDIFIVGLLKQRVRIHELLRQQAQQSSGV